MSIWHSVVFYGYLRVFLLKNFESICEKYSWAANLFILEVLERLYIYWSNFKVIP